MLHSSLGIPASGAMKMMRYDGLMQGWTDMNVEVCSDVEEYEHVPFLTSLESLLFLF